MFVFGRPADAAGHLWWGEALPARLHPGRRQTPEVLRGVRRRPGGGLRRRLRHAHAGPTRRGQPGSEGVAQLDLGMHPEEARVAPMLRELEPSASALRNGFCR